MSSLFNVLYVTLISTEVAVVVVLAVVAIIERLFALFSFRLPQTARVGLSVCVCLVAAIKCSAFCFDILCV